VHSGSSSPGTSRSSSVARVTACACSGPRSRLASLPPNTRSPRFTSSWPRARGRARPRSATSPASPASWWTAVTAGERCRRSPRSRCARTGSGWTTRRGTRLPRSPTRSRSRRRPRPVARAGAARADRQGKQVVEEVARLSPVGMSNPEQLFAVGMAASSVWADTLALPFLQAAAAGARANGRLNLLAYTLVFEA
jgi:hypothetical protein